MSEFYEFWLNKSHWWSDELIRLMGSPFRDAPTSLRDNAPQAEPNTAMDQLRAMLRECAYTYAQEILYRCIKEAIRRNSPLLPVLDEQCGQYLLNSRDGLRFASERINAINKQVEDRASRGVGPSRSTSKISALNQRYQPLQIPQELSPLLASQDQAGIESLGRICKAGKYYCVKFEGEESIVPVKNNEFIFELLLLRENQYMTSLSLCSVKGRPSESVDYDSKGDEVYEGNPDNPLPLTDEKAVKDALSRLDVLRARKEEAHQLGEIDKAVEVEEEIDQISEYLRQVSSLRGKSRKTKGSTSRATDTLRKRRDRLVKEELARSPKLGDLLRSSLQFTGDSVCYRPPNGTPRWQFDG